MTEDHDEADLPNTRGTAGVSRVGATVRKPTESSTPTVHALLEHLHQSGFDLAPRGVEVDDGTGRQTLTYVDGETEASGLDDRVWYDALPEAARRLRQVHDITASFVPPADASWREPFGSLSRLAGSAALDGSTPVICHGDWGKHNAVFRDGRLVGMIDWEDARPEHRLYDIGWFALEWCPVGWTTDFAGTEVQPERLRLLCDAYGLDDRTGVLDAVWSRLETFVVWLEEGAAAGDPPRLSRVEDGEAVHHRERLVFLEGAQEDFAAALR